MKKNTHLLRDYIVDISASKFRKAFAFTALLGATVTLSAGCGILGDKKDASRSLAQSGGACLDDLGPLANQFLDGTVSESRWRATWDCVDDTIDLFKKFVKGSETEGYTPEDIRFLVQKFLFARGDVSVKFVDGTLAIKASLFGGTEKRLSTQELDNFRLLARFLKEETSVLIPHLRNRKTHPNATNLRALSLAIENFGVRLADHLGTNTHQKLTIDQAVAFTTELAKLAFKTDAKTVEVWTRLGLQVKTILVRGAADGVNGADWTKMLKYGAKAAGAAIAYLDIQGDDPLFQTEMVDRIQSVLNSSISDWNGELPFAEIEKLVDLAPNSLLPELADDFRKGTKKLFHERVETIDGRTTRYRASIARFLQTRTDTGIDAAAVERLVSVYRQGMRANSALTAIFAGQKEDLTRAEFDTRARAYLNTLPTSERSHVYRVMSIASRFPGLHPANTPEILFLDQEKHSLNNLNRMQWYELAAGVLMDAYASSSNASGKAAVLGDLDIMLKDLDGFLYGVHMSHPLKTNVGAKRFREANLFMPNGNGDDLMDIPETTVYLAYVFSAARLNTRIMELALEGANPCPMKGWNVPLKLKVYDVQCYRDRLAANFAEIYQNMPLLRDEVTAMSISERATWNQTLEYAAKTTGYNNDPVTSFDVSSYAGLPHFAEGVMSRFDRNHDGALDRDETLDYVFPIFKRELAGISKIKIDFVNKAVLLYLMQTGEQPKVADLATWALNFDFLKKFSARRIRIYQIFAALSPPAPADPISQTPPPGIYPPPPPGSVSSSSLAGNSGDHFMLGITPVVTAATPVNQVSSFDLGSVDPAQLEGYDKNGPVIDPSSPYKEALEVLPQDL